MAGYRITKQREGTHVSFWPDPRGPGHGVLYKGLVESHIGDTVDIGWYESPEGEFMEQWDARDMRYRVDRGQMILKPPPKERRVRLPADELLCKVCGKPRQLKCGHRNPGALKPEEWGGQKVVPALLTPVDPHDMMESSNGGDAPIMRKGHMMAKKAAPVEEVDEEVTEDTGEDMLSAKAAASKLGTDGRTLRKFLRKKHGTVGQGQRWAIAASDIESLKAEFTEWSKSGQSRSEKKATDKVIQAADDDEIEPLAEAELDALEEIEDLDFGDDD